MENQIEDVLRRKGIDPATVIEAKVEMRADRMWRTKADWPLGGTYEADVPRNVDDIPVAERVRTTATVDIIGRHPEGQLLPVVSGEREISRVEVVDVEAWINRD